MQRHWITGSHSIWSTEGRKRRDMAESLNVFVGIFTTPHVCGTCNVALCVSFLRRYQLQANNFPEQPWISQSLKYHTPHYKQYCHPQKSESVTCHQIILVFHSSGDHVTASWDDASPVLGSQLFSRWHWLGWLVPVLTLTPVLLWWCCQSCPRLSQWPGLTLPQSKSI